LLKTNDIQKILKTEGKEDTLYRERRKARIMADFLSGTIK